MRKIALTKGRFALVDDDDYATISQFRWYAQETRTKVYACRRRSKGEGGGIEYMHRRIAGTPPGLLTDHIDCDGLNNTKTNLLPATTTQNVMNSVPQQGRLSTLKGTCRDPRKGMSREWIARIRVAKKSIHLGRFSTEEEAAAAYRRAAIEHFGEFHRTSHGAQS